MILQCLKIHQDQFVNINSSSVLTTQDEEFVKKLEDLDRSEITSDNPNLSDESRISGCFCSKTVFNLSERVLSETEIKILKSRFKLCPYTDQN